LWKSATTLLGGIHHELTFLGVEDHWLLDEYVATGFEC